MLRNIKSLCAALVIQVSVLAPPSLLWAAPRKKLQEVNFSEMDVQGSARTPDGTYLVQRRGLRFLPLYEVKKDFDQKIRKATSYLK